MPQRAYTIRLPGEADMTIKLPPTPCDGERAEGEMLELCCGHDTDMMCCLFCYFFRLKKAMLDICGPLFGPCEVLAFLLVGAFWILLWVCCAWSSLVLTLR